LLSFKINVHLLGMHTNVSFVTDKPVLISCDKNQRDALISQIYFWK